MLGSLFTRFTSSKDEEVPRHQRREQRWVVTDGTVEIDGELCPLINWSYSGFLAESYGGFRRAGDKVDIVFSVALEDDEPEAGRFEFECQAMLVRIDRESRKVVGAFFEMATATRIEIARHFG